MGSIVFPSRVSAVSGRKKSSRLVESKTTVPHFYLETEVDAGPLMKLRAALNANLAELPPDQGGIKFSVTDFILKGSAEALRRVPQVNASWMGDRVRQHGAVHLSLAIAVPDGLVTPKIENAHSKTLRQVAVEAKDLGLDKPWEESGKEEPDSLVQQQRIVRKRVQDSLRGDA